MGAHTRFWVEANANVQDRRYGPQSRCTGILRLVVHAPTSRSQYSSSIALHLKVDLADYD